MKTKSIKIARLELLKTKGDIKIETPTVGSLPLDGDLSVIISKAIKTKITQENEEK